MFLEKLLSIEFFSSQKRLIFLFIVLCLLVVGILLAESLYSSYVERKWEAIQKEEEQNLHENFQSRFLTYYQETLHLTEQIALDPTVKESIFSSNIKPSAKLFEALLSHANPILSIEVYDREHTILGWVGDRGPSIDLQVMPEQHESFILEGPIYSYLVISVPIVDDENILCYVIGKRLFDVNLPISNRFISSSAFTSAFTSQMSFQPEFIFSSTSNSEKGEQFFFIPLLGNSNQQLGFASLPKPLLSSRLDEIHHTARLVVNVLFLGLLGILIALVFRLKAIQRLSLIKILAITMSIWLLRYAFVWTNFPSEYLRSSIFGPAFFASPFGYGIAKSAGDLFITAVFLCANIIAICQYLSRYNFSVEKESLSISAAKKALALGTFFLSPYILFIVLRGYFAAIHSAVFDSSLVYNDPTTVIPSFEVSLILLSLLLISFSLAITTVGVLLFSQSLVNGIFLKLKDQYHWIIVVVLYFVSSILFELIHHNPLTSQEFRILFLLGFIPMTAWLKSLLDRRFALLHPKILGVLFCVGVILLVPLLDRKVHEYDRSHVELVANEIIRPQDSWLTFVMNQTLDDLSSNEIAQIFSSGERDELENLAFAQWAKSILSREGYNCSITFMNYDGEVISDFHVGVAPHDPRFHEYDLPAISRFIDAGERKLRGGTVKWYTGYTPIMMDNGILIGGVWVEFNADRQTLLRGEAPDVLRNYGKENFERHHRRLVLSEYFQGKLIYSTEEDVPLDRPLPSGLKNYTSYEGGIWLDDIIEGEVYETYFIPRTQDEPNNSWIALGMEALDVRWHVFTYLRYVLFSMIFAICIILIVLMIRVLRGDRIVVDFRMKVVLSFIVVSLIPVMIVAYYNRQYATERLEESTMKKLNDRTSVVVAEVQRQLGMTVPFSFAQITDELCADIATDLNTDFNLYSGFTLQASSKPEMFEAELLDRTISASAFLNIFLKKKGFFYERQLIGTLPYTVGYRPLVSDAGDIVGAVSVPTLYHQAEVAEELTKRNVFLFSAYAIALVLALIIGTIFANQISSPIRRLKLATQRIAAGELELDIPVERKDELGELEAAFKQMTRDLKRTQEQMIKTQRELAWKEMAKQVAHEIKNPLTPIKLSIQHLRQAYADGVKDFGHVLHRVSTTILDQIDALSRIASEFAHFARLPERKLEPCNVNEVLLEAKNLFQQHKDIKFMMHLQADKFVVLADREELRRAFINLLRNAIQAMRERGTITLTTYTVHNLIEITITDTGPGISSKIKERMFEPNFSTKTDGMGLGLPIVKKIIDDLGGTISIDSVLGRGTTVIVRLPVSSSQ
ncbi:MAG: HAMP domain-containing protein [Ignavibacteriae bacterium]|nr:HAMP domain-containing protein [Ignavibacteriota bacterium]